MALYLLDTNILSDILKNPQGLAAQKLTEHPQESLCTSIIVAAEMRYGAAKKNAEALTERVNQLLDVIKILSFSPDADHCYGQVRAQLERKGQTIGANDLLIAAHALSVDAILVTANVNEFSRVSGLTMENWLA
ncbi:MAG: tRNA(fMet)-specific endonuclease VapC [Glomeribacter sp. 1016415]|nr:tRNA(fMet)-specific endonuclease VapC [Glomeribacter sp. 1016415]